MTDTPEKKPFSIVGTIKKIVRKVRKDKKYK
jgi:hypothetical protein